VSGEASDDRLVAEVRARVAEQLARLGQAAGLRLDGQCLVLGQGATLGRAELQGTLAQWDSLPEDLRERRAYQIAELLMQGAAPATVLPRPQRLAKRPGWRSVSAPVLVVLVTALSLVVAYRILAPNGPSVLARVSALFHAAPDQGVSLQNSPDPDRERARLASNACDRTRVRISRGATIGPSDVEGWEVELVLLRRGAPADLTLAPGFAAFIRSEAGSHTGRVIWPNARSLVAAQRFDSNVDVQSLPALGSEHLSGLSLVFSGPYAVPYFSEGSRSDYALLADALADAVSATDGALFARCAGSESHQIGYWFLGQNPAAAASSLVYFMGSYSDAPILKSTVLGSRTDPEHYGHAFDIINQAARELTRGALATLIGRELGVISGRPSRPTRLSFPFRDANRATRSSTDLARALGLAEPG
jgi:hypothetical protein